MAELSEWCHSILHLFGDPIGSTEVDRSAIQATSNALLCREQGLEFVHEHAVL